jgi:hypothetical protein
MQFSIPHKDSKIAAITKVKKALQQSRAQLAGHVTDMQEEWKDNVLHFSFTLQKSHISGTLTITEKTYEIYAKLPLVWRLFEGRIENEIKQQITTLLP